MHTQKHLVKLFLTNIVDEGKFNEAAKVKQDDSRQTTARISTGFGEEVLFAAGVTHATVSE